MKPVRADELEMTRNTEREYTIVMPGERSLHDTGGRFYEFYCRRLNLARQLMVDGLEIKHYRGNIEDALLDRVAWEMNQHLKAHPELEFARAQRLAERLGKLPSIGNG